jgi:hypothetical protein
MSFVNEFDRLIGRKRLVEWTLESVDSLKATFDALLKTHLAQDVKMNAQVGYVPSKGVLAQRELHRQADEVMAIGKLVRGDFWQEWSGKDKVQVGFRDNRDRQQYTDDVEKLSDALAAKGYKLNAHASSRTQVVVLRMKDAEKIDAMRPEWLKAMNNAGADVTMEGKLSEAVAPDETFAAAFAGHRTAEGIPMSLADWKATMQLALEQNLAPEESDFTYNKFDLNKVSDALAPFSNLSFTPGREFGPVVTIGGDPATLAVLAKVAEKRLGAFEAKMVSKNRLRVVWD